ncbi:MAG: FAD-dependent oxidoreductase, partial [Clostridia bacterium]|nr:FAD-dependent oxidoreductase [Clostridia bacterium]
MVYDIVIVGAGVCGGMIARELSKFDLRVCLLEKANDVAMGASKANSGIIHGGFDPEPGTLKQRFNTEGIELLFEAARELNVPHRRNGSLVCAFSRYEEEQLGELYGRGVRNGVKGLRLISGDEARALEPALSPAVTLALHVPDAGIVCPYKLTIAAVGNAMDNGVELHRNFEVTGIEHSGGIFTLKSAAGESVSTKYLINCAGGHAGKVAAMAGDDSIEIIPRAGEYMLLDRSEGKTVGHTIFRAPSKEGKGILVSLTADGNLLLGPTAARVDTPDNTETTREGLAAVARS